jgi:hypothetical protein
MSEKKTELNNNNEEDLTTLLEETKIEHEEDSDDIDDTLFEDLETMSVSTNSKEQQLRQYISAIKHNNIYYRKLDYRSYFMSNLTPEITVLLIDALRQNHTISVFECSGLKYIDDIKERNLQINLQLQLLEALRHNPRLKEINFHMSDLRDEEVKKISSYFLNHSSLEKINLSYNNIGSEGARYLSELLRTTSSLTSLRLNMNSIQNEGIRYIAEALRYNNILYELDLDNNRITDEGAIPLFRIIAKHNFTLVYLNISHGNNITPFIIDAFKHLMEDNKNYYHTLELHRQGVLLKTMPDEQIAERDAKMELKWDTLTSQQQKDMKPQLDEKIKEILKKIHKRKEFIANLPEDVVRPYSSIYKITLTVPQRLNLLGIYNTRRKFFKRKRSPREDEDDDDRRDLKRRKTEKEEEIHEKLKKMMIGETEKEERKE